MSGQTGSRGYLAQALICVLDSLDNQGWCSLILEPNLDSDKVDIIWYYSDHTSAVQIKHSQNPISLGKVKNWAKELEDSIEVDEYQLRLIGPCTIDVTKQQTYGKVSIPTPLPLNLSAFIELAAQKFDKYLTSKGISQVPPFARELLVEALTTRLASYSTSGTKVSREDFDKLLIEWILVVYPNALNQASIAMKLEYEEKLRHLELELRERDRIATAKYQLKYKACLEALDVIDQIFLAGSREEFIRRFPIEQLPKFKSPSELGDLARKCHNKLVIAVNNPKVVRLFRQAAGIDTEGQKPSVDIVVDLRTAIRRELEFGDEVVDTDRSRAWFGAVSVNIGYPG